MLFGFGRKECGEIRVRHDMLRGHFGIDDPAKRYRLDELLELRQLLGVASLEVIEFPTSRPAE
jgi:hypothetical protein